MAQDSVSLLACAQRTNGGEFDRILITGPIGCSGPNACALVVYRRHRPLTIEGAPASDAGLFRGDTMRISAVPRRRSPFCGR